MTSSLAQWLLVSMKNGSIPKLSGTHQNCSSQQSLLHIWPVRAGEEEVCCSVNTAFPMLWMTKPSSLSSWHLIDGSWEWFFYKNPKLVGTKTRRQGVVQCVGPFIASSIMHEVYTTLLGYGVIRKTSMTFLWGRRAQIPVFS